MDPTEEELESFRRQWREDLAKKGKASASAAATKTSQASSSRTQAPRGSAPDVPSHARGLSVEEDDIAAPHEYSDLGDKQHGRRLDETGPPKHDSNQEPSTALEHYEKAVEKEGIGSLGDSVNLYRKAYRVSSKFPSLLSLHILP